MVCHSTNMSKLGAAIFPRAGSSERGKIDFAFYWWTCGWDCSHRQVLWCCIWCFFMLWHWQRILIPQAAEIPTGDQESVLLGGIDEMRLMVQLPHLSSLTRGSLTYEGYQAALLTSDKPELCSARNTKNTKLCHTFCSGERRKLHASHSLHLHIVEQRPATR